MNNYLVKCGMSIDDIENVKHCNAIVHEYYTRYCTFVDQNQTNFDFLSCLILAF